ncbi:MAG: aminoglycoside adenylyltransferase family protein [Amaricoccus sp.]
MDAERQIEAAVAVARRCLGDALAGAWLYGSATHGGLRRWSDIDLLLLATDRPAEPVRRRLMLGWLPLSGAPGGTLRPVEVTLLALPDIQPWRWPPWRVLQFGEWLRPEIEGGSFESPQPDPDVALLIAQARARGRSLIGPPPAELLPDVPPDDLRSAIAKSLPYLLQGWREDVRNALLTLARMWLTVSTGEIAPKDAAAAWAAARLPPDLAPLLARARADYLGLADADWTATPKLARLVEHLRAEIEADLATGKKGDPA